METYTLISYILTKYSNPDTSYLALELNLADLDEVMDNFKLTIVGTSEKEPMIKKPSHLDPLCKELLEKLTKTIGNELAFGVSESKGMAYLYFSEKVHDKYVLLTI